MAKRATKEAVLDTYAFFNALWVFYQENRGIIRSNYKQLSKKFIDYNDPVTNPKAFLRQPQFEALEIYVFLKEYLNNTKIEAIFKDWYEHSGKFTDRVEQGLADQLTNQMSMFEKFTQEQYKTIFAAMRKNSRLYANYIFALTMGVGKTILMATCIFYEFILANKWPKDTRYCHNALVFAPDKTVLRSLREIEAFDLALVVPPEYVNFLISNIRFHYLEETGTSLDTLDKSKFNIIVSNNQKIILKRKNTQPSATDRFYGLQKETFKLGDVYSELDELIETELPSVEDLTTNQRFEKLTRLEQLGIYIDEAHHAFGKTLAKDMGIGAKESDNSLRTTVDMLAKRLELAGTKVVACYNYTGTPYVGKDVLPEVVYAYGLQEAIKNAYLKKVDLHGYRNTKSIEFLKETIDHFLTETEGLRPEGILPKLAIFGTTIDEVRNELKPELEKILSEKGIPNSRILINLGDSETTNDDLREFNHLDAKESEKQFILLVNKGREGWNCRSLFGVAMFRAPKSKIFVLQATMRCLRAIGDIQYTGQVYLSDENMQILNDELQQNFRITADELQKLGKDKETVIVKVNKQPKITLQRVRKTYNLKEKQLIKGAEIGLKQDNKEAWHELTKNYHMLKITQHGLAEGGVTSQLATKTEDLTYKREKLHYSAIMLVAEIARYLNKNPLEIEHILELTKEKTIGILNAINEFNELLYDVVIPNLFKLLYDTDETIQTEEYDVELVKLPPNGYYAFTTQKDKIVRDTDPVAKNYKDKSFHLDTYCFDSNPEQQLFWDLLQEDKVSKVYFTGMLTHGQSDFYIQYIDPESGIIRSYYPDFIFQKNDGSYVIVEVKADHMIDDRVVQAKARFTQEIAVASDMTYEIIKGTDALNREYRKLLM